MTRSVMVLLESSWEYTKFVGLADAELHTQTSSISSFMNNTFNYFSDGC